MLSLAAGRALPRHGTILLAAPASAPPRHEVKFLSLDLKDVDTDGSFEGYASVFHREDMSRDVVMPGAFAQSLRERGAAGIKMLFQHDAERADRRVEHAQRGCARPLRYRPAHAGGRQGARGARADARGRA